jgi:hypothetical protein
LLFADEVRHKSLQLGRVLNLVLRLAKNNTEGAGLSAEFRKGVPILHLKGITIETMKHLQSTSAGTMLRLLNGGFVCSSAILRNNRKVNCSK